MYGNVYRVVYEFSRELPWQPQLGKNGPKLHWFQFWGSTRSNLLHN